MSVNVVRKRPDHGDPDRPHARNAVDGPTARSALRGVRRVRPRRFRGRCGAVGGPWNLSAPEPISRRSARRTPTPPTGREGWCRRRVHSGPSDGPHPPGAVQPVIAAVSVCRRRRAGTGAVVRPPGGRGGRGVRRLLPTLGCAAHRRRHRAVAPSHRAQPGNGHDPHRSRGSRAGGIGHRAGQPGGAHRRGRGAAEELAAELARSPQGVCARTVSRRCTSGAVRKPRRSTFEFGSLARVAEESLAGAQRFAGGAGRHGAPA